MNCIARQQDKTSNIEEILINQWAQLRELQL